MTCTIPQSTGQDISVKNQFGIEVRLDTTLKNYIRQTSDPSSVPLNEESGSDDQNYDLEISWTPDRDVQERLKILQCVAFFHRTNFICKTSVVNIHFINEPEGIHFFLYRSIIRAIIVFRWV